jgi:hypothetical protein
MRVLIEQTRYQVVYIFVRIYALYSMMKHSLDKT